jgi:hypothetical protein
MMACTTVIQWQFAVLFEALGLIAAAMQGATDSELRLLDRVFERVRQDMIQALYSETEED